MNLTWQKFLDYVAFAISAVLSPYLAAAVFIVIVVYSYAQDLNQFLPWMLTFFLFAIIIPGFYILWLLEAKTIEDIHLARLSDRKVPFLIAAVSSLVGAVLLYILNAARPVFVVSVIYAINSLMMAIVTLRWKISVHTGMFASIATISVIVFGSQFCWLYLFLIPLSWARVYRKRHTIWQAVTGAISVTLLTLFVFWVFDYI